MRRARAGARLAERPATLDSAHIAAAAVPFEGGYRLNGTKRYVSGAAGADVFIVAARNEGGLVLACVDRNAPGVQIDLELLADGRHFERSSCAMPSFRGNASQRPVKPPRRRSKLRSITLPPSPSSTA